MVAHVLAKRIKFQAISVPPGSMKNSEHLKSHQNLQNVAPFSKYNIALLSTMSSPNGWNRL
jgi:hypothetical protein